MAITITLDDNFKPIPLPYRDAWVAALRSGDYERGRDWLESPQGGYCCLGVLIDVQLRLHREGVKKITGPLPSLEGETLVISNPCYPVLRSLGKIPEGIKVTIEDHYSSHRTLAEINDTTSASFNDIADIIEAAYVDDSADPPGDRDVFIVGCDTVCDGLTPVATVAEADGKKSWDVYATEREAQLEIIDDMEICIQQFKDGERDFDEILNNLVVLPATLHADGSLSTEFGFYPAPE